jgi:hypothetical protein
MDRSNFSFTEINVLNSPLIERYVIDIDSIGTVFKNKLIKILVIDRDIPYNYNERLNRVFTESVSQVLMILDNNIDDFLLKLIAIPEMRYFKDIVEFTEESNVERYKSAFKEFAVELGYLVNNTINKQNNQVDYLLESCTYSYIIVIKHNKH